MSTETTVLDTPINDLVPMPQNPLVVADGSSPLELAHRYLEELNLPAEQANEAVQMAQKISLQSGDKTAIASLGKDCSARMSSYADTILKQIRVVDENGVQDRLSELVLNAKSLNLNGIGRKSSVPIIGGLIDRFVYKTNEWKLKFQNVATKINSLLEELKNGERNIIARQKELDNLFEATQHEYKQLGLSIVAGKIKQVELSALIESELLLVNGDQLKAQYVSDLRSLAVVLDKRISDLLALQTSAMQTLPSIRLIQHNNQLLLEKLNNVRELTIPAWKRQFMLLVASQEQEKIVELVNDVDETTNDLLRSNAELLGQNTLETARISQRGVIDVATLEAVQQSLISTIEGVKTIYNEGMVHRQEAERTMISLQRDLRERLTKSEQTS